MKMQYEISGRGAPIALVPGGLTGWQSWQPHGERLAKDRRVIRLQLLSVQLGLEDRPLPGDYSVRTESTALTATLEELGLYEPIDIVAWSFGALVSLDYALNNPDRIRTLTLIEPPAFWLLSDPDDGARQLFELCRTMTGDVSEEQLAQFCRLVEMAPPGQAPEDLPQWPNWSRHRQSLRNGQAAVMHTDDPNRLGTLRRPVLLVRGTGSAACFHRIIGELQARLPDARVEEWPSGHAPHIVSMNLFLNHLRNFHKSAVGAL